MCRLLYPVFTHMRPVDATVYSGKPVVSDVNTTLQGWTSFSGCVIIVENGEET